MSSRRSRSGCRRSTASAQAGPEDRLGWADQKVIREIMIFLHSHGVSTARSVRIFKTYGADAIQVLSENPYRLARDVRGIGFKTADTIAARLGIEKTAMIRARAGIGFTLTEAMDDGHCGLPLDELVPVAERLLEIPASIVEHALDLELEAGEVVADDVDGRRCIFLAGLHRAERAIADRLRALREGVLPWPHVDPAKAIVGRGQGQHHARREPAGSAPARSALEGAGHHRRPGVGKTTLINSILKVLGAKGIEIALAAPTGRGQAARVLAAWPRPFTVCSTSIPDAAASGATRRARSGAICSSSTRRRWSTYPSCTQSCALCLSMPR